MWDLAGKAVSGSMGSLEPLVVTSGLHGPGRSREPQARSRQRHGAARPVRARIRTHTQVRGDSVTCGARGVRLRGELGDWRVYDAAPCSEKSRSKATTIHAKLLLYVSSSSFRLTAL